MLARSAGFGRSWSGCRSRGTPSSSAILWWGISTGLFWIPGGDTHIWDRAGDTLRAGGEVYAIQPLRNETIWYSPPFVVIFGAVSWLPIEVMYVAIVALEVAALRYLAGSWLGFGLACLFPLTAVELVSGNFNMLVAAAIVAAIQPPPGPGHDHVVRQDLADPRGPSARLAGRRGDGCRHVRDHDPMAALCGRPGSPISPPRTVSRSVRRSRSRSRSGRSSPPACFSSSGRGRGPPRRSSRSRPCTGPRSSSCSPRSPSSCAGCHDPPTRPGERSATPAGRGPRRPPGRSSPSGRTSRRRSSNPCRASTSRSPSGQPTAGSPAASRIAPRRSSPAPARSCRSSTRRSRCRSSPSCRGCRGSPSLWASVALLLVAAVATTRRLRIPWLWVPLVVAWPPFVEAIVAREPDDPPVPRLRRPVLPGGGVALARGPARRVATRRVGGRGRRAGHGHRRGQGVAAARLAVRPALPLARRGHRRDRGGRPRPR